MLSGQCVDHKMQLVVRGAGHGTYVRRFCCSSWLTEKAIGRHMAVLLLWMRAGIMRGDRKSGQVAHRCEFDTDCMKQEMYKQATKDGVPRRRMQTDCRTAVSGHEI